MATAGAGDVLSGILGALRATGLQPLEAAVVGISVHGRAGDIAAQRKGVRSVIASDLLEAIPEAFHVGNFSSGIARIINPSNKGTVKAISP